MAGVYRDALVGLRARVAELVEAAREREQSFAPDLVSHLPCDLRERLAEKRDACSLRGETLDELARALHDASEYIELLDRALALAPGLVDKLRSVPPSDTRIRRRRPLASFFMGQAVREEALAEVRAALERAVARHDPRAALASPEPRTFAAQLHAHGAPLALLVECFVDHERPFEPRVQVGTSMAHWERPVHAAPETWTHAFARTMGQRARSVTGDEAFDERFIIEGEPQVVRSLLGPDVRAALLVIAREDVPDFRVADGMAVLAWSFEPSDRALDAAFFALGRVRTVEIPQRLRVVV